MKKVLVIGDSHTGVLNQARREMARGNTLPAGVNLDIRPLAGGPTLARPFFEEADGIAIITAPSIKARVSRLPPAGEGFDAIVLSGPLHPVRVWRNKDWARHRLASADGFAPVSSALFRRVVGDDMGQMLRLLEILKTHVDQVLVIEPPRPFRHHPSIREIGAETVLDVDRRYRVLVRTWLAEREIGTVDVPACCLDADGFMATQYRSPRERDPHHGNAAFGALMLRALAAKVAAAPVERGRASRTAPGSGTGTGASSPPADRLANGRESAYVAGQ